MLRGNLSAKEGGGSLGFVGAPGPGQRAHPQRLSFFDEAATRKAFAVLCDQSERVREVAARVGHLSAREQLELGRVRLLGRRRACRALRFRRGGHLLIDGRLIDGRHGCNGGRRKHGNRGRCCRVRAGRWRRSILAGRSNTKRGHRGCRDHGDGERRCQRDDEASTARCTQGRFESSFCRRRHARTGTRERRERTAAGSGRMTLAPVSRASTSESNRDRWAS